ncbi:MAG: hypothetical protein ACRCZP_19105, partial [Phycicoccus sp.]
MTPGPFSPRGVPSIPTGEGRWRPDSAAVLRLGSASVVVRAAGEDLPGVLVAAGRDGCRSIQRPHVAGTCVVMTYPAVVSNGSGTVE